MVEVICQIDLGIPAISPQLPRCQRVEITCFRSQEDNRDIKPFLETSISGREFDLPNLTPHRLSFSDRLGRLFDRN